MPYIAQNLSKFSAQEISHLFNHARLHMRANGIRILTAPAQREFGRILIVTPRSSGNSVQRHLFKRRIKAIFYEKQLYAKSLDFVIIVNKNGIDPSFKNLTHTLLRLFSVGKPPSTPTPASA